MKTLVSAAVALGAASLPIDLACAGAPAPPNEIVLHCVGYNVMLGADIEQFIEIDGDFATVAGEKYLVDRHPSAYGLRGPLGAWQPNSGKPAPMFVSIDRTTGQYLMYPGNTGVGGHPSEYSRLEDQGCRSVRF